MMRLFDHELSADGYQVRLLAAILGVPLECVPVDTDSDDDLPWLDTAGGRLCGAAAILIYLAGETEAGSAWLSPADRLQAARIQYWLGFAARLSVSVGLARRHETMMVPADIDACRRAAVPLLRHLDETLWFGEQEERPFLVGPSPTLADIACFPDVALAEEGGIAHLPYPAIRRWLDRVKRIPGFVPTPGLFLPDPPSVSPPSRPA